MDHCTKCKLINKCFAETVCNCPCVCSLHTSLKELNTSCDNNVSLLRSLYSLDQCFPNIIKSQFSSLLLLFLDLVLSCLPLVSSLDLFVKVVV